MKAPAPTKCLLCGVEIYQTHTGRPRKYCDACRSARLSAAAKKSRKERQNHTLAEKRAAQVASRAVASRAKALEEGVKPDSAAAVVSEYRGQRTITRGRAPGGPSTYTNLMWRPI